MKNFKQVLKILLLIITLCLIGCSTNNKKDAGTGHIRNDSTYSIYQSSNVLVKRDSVWKAILSHVSGFKKTSF